MEDSLSYQLSNKGLHNIKKKKKVIISKKKNTKKSCLEAPKGRLQVLEW